MNTFARQNYVQDPSGTQNGAMVQCGMEEGRSESEDAERARRILQEEMPKRIERLRGDLRNLFLGERGQAGGQNEQGQAA